MLAHGAGGGESFRTLPNAPFDYHREFLLQVLLWPLLLLWPEPGERMSESRR
jgi:hypothetical protein